MHTQAHKTGACLLAKMQSDAALGYSSVPPRLGVSLDSRTAAAAFHQRNYPIFAKMNGSDWDTTEACTLSPREPG